MFQLYRIIARKENTKEFTRAAKSANVSFVNYTVSSSNRHDIIVSASHPLYRVRSSHFQSQQSAAHTPQPPAHQLQIIYLPSVCVCVVHETGAIRISKVTSQNQLCVMRVLCFFIPIHIRNRAGIYLYDIHKWCKWCLQWGGLGVVVVANRQLSCHIQYISF